MKNKTVLVTGGAGFIGSNLVDELLLNNNKVVCLDNFSTGTIENLSDALENSNFKLIEGDIRDYSYCEKSVIGCDVVFHQAALGSVPRSISDPMTSTDVNIGGFVKMLHASKEAGIIRFVYAASSSTYGDHPGLPKVEHKIGNSLSPYAITKYVDELFAKNFSDLYGIETVGLRYFNVFGRRQNPNGAYAAVIPKFVENLIRYESPSINGDGTYSRDFTFIQNVIQANIKAATISSEDFKTRITEYNISRKIKNDESKVISEIFNVAYGERTTLNDLAAHLKKYLSEFDPKIDQVTFKYGQPREGDVPHSLASIDKAKEVLNYSPTHAIHSGLKEACKWYFNNIKIK